MIAVARYQYRHMPREDWNVLAEGDFADCFDHIKSNMLPSLIALTRPCIVDEDGQLVAVTMRGQLFTLPSQLGYPVFYQAVDYTGVDHYMPLGFWANLNEAVLHFSAHAHDPSPIDHYDNSDHGYLVIHLYLCRFEGSAELGQPLYTFEWTEDATIDDRVCWKFSVTSNGKDGDSNE